MLYLGRAHALASICTVFRCITKVFVSSNFWGVTSWYQSFSLSELRIDGRIPRLKLDKLRIISPTLGRVLGGESVLSYTEVHESELR
jgi:hypothetical protein